MRKTVIFAAFVAAMGAASCQRAEIKEVSTSFTFGIQQPESQTKTDLYGVNEIHWATGDQVYLNCGSWEAFTLSSGAGTRVGTFTINKDVTINNNGTLALYPATLSPEWTTSDAAGWHITLPDSYEWSARGIKAPMMTYLNETNPAWQEFTIITSAIKVDVSDIPANADKLVFTAPGKRVSGQFRIHEVEGTKDVVTEDSAEKNTVSITFPAGTADVMTFIIPVPVGTYTNFTLQFYEGDTPIAGTGRRSSLTVATQKIHYLPAYSCSTTPAQKPETVIWEGNYEVGSWTGMTDLANAAAFANLKDGSVLTVYGTEAIDTGEWIALLIKRGDWNYFFDNDTVKSESYMKQAWASGVNSTFKYEFPLNTSTTDLATIYNEIKSYGLLFSGLNINITKITLKDAD